MRSRAALFAAVLFACSASGPPPVLQHYEIRADELPPPFATASAGNPPIVRPGKPKFVVPAGFKVEVWASGFDDPRNMVYAPNGDIYVAEPGAGKITILRGGRPNDRATFASRLNGPFGLAFAGGSLYVGCEDELIRFTAGKRQHIASLPGGGHSTRNVVTNGSKLYVAVGSESNVNDETRTPMRAAITEMNLDGSGARIFASGLRNPVGLAWNPANGTLWTAVNERDGLGDDLVPDYVTDVHAGEFFGWPFSYIGKNVDPRRQGEHPELVAKAVVPALLLQSHSAPLGIAFYEGSMFPAQYRGGLFVAMHGSWNRTQRTGYKVVFVPFRNGRPAGGYDDFVIGWSTDPSSHFVYGRPVGLLVMRDGSLLVSDDGTGTIFRVSR